MDTEDAFWNHLEANPSDSVARLVFADWLQEQGDQRAEGMRVLGRLGKYASRWQDACAYPESVAAATGYWLWRSRDEEESPTTYPDTLGDSWFWALQSVLEKIYNLSGMQENPEYWHVPFREVESAASLAWLDLTQEERDGICKLD